MSPWHGYIVAKYVTTRLVAINACKITISHKIIACIACIACIVAKVVKIQPSVNNVRITTSWMKMGITVTIA